MSEKLQPIEDTLSGYWANVQDALKYDDPWARVLNYYHYVVAFKNSREYWLGDDMGDPNAELWRQDLEACNQFLSNMEEIPGLIQAEHKYQEELRKSRE